MNQARGLLYKSPPLSDKGQPLIFADLGVLQSSLLHVSVIGTIATPYFAWAQRLHLNLTLGDSPGCLSRIGPMAEFETFFFSRMLHRHVACSFKQASDLSSWY